MNEMKVTANTKGLRKAAFAVGFGFTFGAGAAIFLCGALGGVVTSVMQREAKKGTEFAQDVCEKAGIEYEEHTNDGSKIMGFHC